MDTQMAADPSVVVVICTTLGASVANLVIQIMQYLRESRQHRWAVEQSASDQRQRLEVAEALRNHTDAKSQEISDNTSKGVAILSDKIDENTTISVKAFDVANGVNEKLVAIGEARLKGSPTDRRKIDHIVDTVDHTAGVVDGIAETVAQNK